MTSPSMPAQDDNGDERVTSTSNADITTTNGATQRPRWKVLIEKKRAEAEAATHDTQSKETPADRPVATGQRGSRPSEQHTTRTLEGETLNGVTHPQSYADAIPDVNSDKPESVTLSDSIVENVIGQADVLTVFPRWGKGDTPRDTSGDEVQFRCPTPTHADTNPSASINKKTGLWTCFGCEAGGDIFTLGGIKFNIDPTSSDLPKLKRLMAEELTGKSFIEHGPYSVIDVPAVNELVEAENKEWERHEAEDNRVLQEKLQDKEALEAQQKADLDEYMAELNESLYGELVPEPTPQPATDSAPDSPANAPTHDPEPALASPTRDDSPTQTTSTEQESHEPTPQTPQPASLLTPPPGFTGYDELLKHGTFLSEFYNSCKKDSNPNDFHFFHGLAGLGFASGRNVTLNDVYPVMGNLFLCFVAGTGSGKSSSNRYLAEVLNSGLAWDESHRDGVKVLARPGSGEVLIDQMTDKVVVNPITGVPTKGRVKGYLNYDELTQLVKQGARQGSTIDTVLTSMYDGSDASAGSRASGTVRSTEPYLTMTSNIPPATMREMFTHGSATSGFLNRFTFVTINEYKQQRAMGAPVIPDYDYLGSKLAEIAEWAQTPTMVTANDEALDLIEQFFNMELAQYSPRTGIDVDPMMVRVELMFKKFCLLFAVNEMSETLTRDHVEKAIKLYWITKPGFVKTSDSVGQSATQVLEDAIVEKVTSYFVKHGESLTVGDIWNRHCKIMRVAKREGLERYQFDQALRSLVSTGDLEEVKPLKGDSRAKPKYKPGG